MSPEDTDPTGNTTGKSNMGAAFNFNLLHHNPGAQAHDGLDSKLLIFDSIDWLDDNEIDGIIDPTTQPEAARYLQGDNGPSNDAAVIRPPIL